MTVTTVRLAVRSMLLLALVAPEPSPAASAPIPDDARALLDRHVAWLGGWPALDAQRDLTLSGTIEVSGLSGALAMRARRDGYSRLEYDLKVVAGTECLTGGTGWERNASGQIEPMAPDKVKRLVRENERAFSRHLRGDVSERIEIAHAGAAKRKSRKGALLRFTYPDGDLFELLIDPETGESVWSRTVVDGRETWTKLSEVRELGGARFAYRQETFAEHAAENQVVVWKEAAFNTDLATALFDRPASGAKLARLGGGGETSAWIPMELFRERWIYLRGRVNGRETDILLDSGAGATVLDRAFAESAGLRAEGAVAARGTGGVTEAGLVNGVTIEIGELAIGPVAAAVLDLAELTRKSGRPIPVILGKELFHALVVDVDYPGSRIRFHEPDRFRYDGPGRRVELIPGEDGHKSLRLSMEGGDPVVVGLDTGQGGALTVFAHYARERGFLEGRRLSETKGGGVGGFRISKTGTLRAVNLAGFEIRDVPVTFHSEDVKGAFDTKRQEGNLGAGLLNLFRVIFDYAHDALWLEPGASFAAPLPRDRTGLAFEIDGDELEVSFVAPGSPAQAAGWSAGERVRALDGEPVGPDWWRVIARWSRAADGTPARLTLADGRERALTLRAYY